ncbi:hypothetical protein [Halospeciosus flavus]|uniref:Uncharacterized protein n=1 Tax=Halospeciosus flavus TaxID=3032283 RepID=A0ABD5Z082_9EURY
MSLRNNSNQSNNPDTSTPSPSTGRPSSESPKSERINELERQNKLLADRMIELEKREESQNQRINALIERLTSATTDFRSSVQVAHERASSKLLEAQKENFDRLEKQLQKQYEQEKRFYQFKSYSVLVLHVLALVLALMVIGRTLVLGFWQGLFLNRLWALEWLHWRMLTLLIIAALVGGILYLIYRGVITVQKNGFKI